jgi:hypothetical protein
MDPVAGTLFASSAACRPITVLATFTTVSIVSMCNAGEHPPVRHRLWEALAGLYLLLGVFGCPAEMHVEPATGRSAATVRVLFQTDRNNSRLQLLVDGRQARLSGPWSSTVSPDTFVRMRPGWRHVQINVTTLEHNGEDQRVTRCRVARHVYLRNGQQVTLTIRLKSNACVISCGWRHFHAPGQFVIRSCRDRPAAPLQTWGF